MTHHVLGSDCEIDDGATVGYVYDDSTNPAILGDDARVRSGTTIYTDVSVGSEFTTGHYVLIREDTTIGDNVVVGTETVVDGATTIGSDVSIQTDVYVPRETTIGDNVFVGPGAVLTNDNHPIRGDGDLTGPTIEDGASIGANATVLPGVTIGANAFVGAGAIVTEDVSPGKLAVGAPAETEALPDPLAGGNTIA